MNKKRNYSMKRNNHILASIVLAVAALHPAAMGAQETRTVNDTIYNPKVIFTASPTYVSAPVSPSAPPPPR